MTVIIRDFSHLVNTKPLHIICQVVPSEMADKLFEACGSDSYEKLDSAVKVKSSFTKFVM